MPLQLLPASFADMDELVRVIYAAYSDPHDPFVDLCTPGLGHDSPVRRVRGERETAADYLEDWKDSVSTHWLKVVDSDTGKIVSASNWEIYDHNPHENPQPIEAHWLPKGSRLREYANFLINARAAQGRAHSQCAHASLEICVTLPKYRRRGAAAMMLQWGVDRADELGVKCIVEATVDGQPLYQRFGFVTKQVVDTKKEGMDADEEWMKLQKRYPLVSCWMERPRKLEGSKLTIRNP